MKKGIIILGPQGAGKTTLANTIVSRFDRHKVFETDVNDTAISSEPTKADKWGKQVAVKAIVVEGLHKPHQILRYTKAWPPHKLIFTSNNLTELDFSEELKDHFNIITLK